jgi:hypothetical protein
MSTVRTSILAVGTFLSLSAMAVAAVATAAPNAALETHTARGAVKFVDSSTLVIHQISPYSGHNMTFTMGPSTEREGDLKVGSTVVVRYEDKPDHRVATLVEVEHAKVPPHTSPSH